MLNIDTIDSYIQNLRGYNYRIAPLIEEIAQVELPTDQELMRLSQRMEKQREEAIALTTRLRDAKIKIKNGALQTVDYMDECIDRQRNAYDEQKEKQAIASFKRGAMIFGCVLCVGLGVVGVGLAITVKDYRMQEACVGYCSGGLCLLGGLWGMVSLIKKIPMRNKTVKDERQRTERFRQEYERMWTLKDEMLSSKEELEQELTALEQDYNSFLARGLKDGWRKSED